MSVQLFEGDCLDIMKTLPSASVDMVLCDLPYGTSDCFWDSIIPFESLWEQYRRIIKNNSAIILFGTQPFTTHLINSNIDWFKYTLVWKKSKCGSALLAKYRPMMKHEDIIIFSKNRERIYYNPIMEIGSPYTRRWTLHKNNNHGFGISGVAHRNTGTRFPGSVLDFPQKWRRQDQTHPTEKPVELLEWLIKSYSKIGDVVLDNCMGTGATGVACVNTGRSFVGIEKDPAYFQTAKARIEKAQVGF